jgi:uncharacterized protein (TIGR03435 family)
MRAIFNLVALLTLAAATFSQAPAAPAHKLEFEVASIKLAGPLDPQKLMSGQMRMGMRVDKALVEISSLPLSELINLAFKTKRYQLTGPSWLTANPMGMDRFDIHATLPEGATEKDVPEMLQALLVERFKLVFHRENVEMPIYALLVGKGGPKMKEAAPDPEPAPSGPGGETAKDNQPQFSGRPDQKGGMVVRGGPDGGNMRMSMQEGAMHMESDKMSMARLAEMLTPFLDHPIVDMTELKGNYQVSLELTMADMMAAARAQGMAVGAGPGGPGGGPGGAGGGAAMPEGAPDPGGSSVFRNVQQLGLKLEARKSEIGKLVIDHLEKTPTEN